MPISCVWDTQEAIWKIKTGETFDLSELSDLVEQTDWKGARSFLWNLRDLVRGPDKTPEIRQAVDLTSRTEKLWVGARVAVLVRRDVDFGIARMFEAYADGIDVEYRVFRDEPAALEWLRPSPHA